MLRPRIIPCLLIRNGGLIKTTNFANDKYVGDPINAVRIYNEKGVDELVVLDISATATDQPPNYSLISTLANECRMPLCYGGGVKTVEQIDRIISLGVEKVAASSAFVANPQLIQQAASRVGNQSVVAVIDVKRCGPQRKPEVVTHNATRRTGLDPVHFSEEVEALGAGEIILNSVDQDGTMNGYDMELISRVRSKVGIPLTAVGGAGSLQHIEELVRKHAFIGAAAGSLFVFKGKYRAVLINYPSPVEKADLLTRAARR